MIVTSQRQRHRRHPRGKRRGAILVWFALLLSLLLGMVGLTVDMGLLLASYRQAQNAADAGAMAGAYDLLNGRSSSTAIATATKFVQDQSSGVFQFDTLVPPKIGPESGPYAGDTNYVEVIAKCPLQTYFIQFLGVGNKTVSARAVAGFEAVASGEGVVALDPTAAPGLNVGGGGTLKVNGAVYVNSQGGGTAWPSGETVNSVYNQPGASVSNNATLLATYVSVVGGVDRPVNFQNYNTGGGNVLYTGQDMIADPLAYLPTPTKYNGVLPNANYGSVSYSKNDTVTLQPGVYNNIKITGGNVTFAPGIYVISPAKNSDGLTITGGNVTGSGIMFYNTGSDYTPLYGDSDNSVTVGAPLANNTLFGNVTITTSVQFSPINTTSFSYPGMPGISVFNGMLFYQARQNQAKIKITGDAGAGNLSGTLYGEWANTQIDGNGTYNAQFIMGSMTISGNGIVTINYTGQNVGKAPEVFLVE